MLPLPPPPYASQVHFGEVSCVASALTPVPGGLGPMTIASLVYNTVGALAQGGGITLRLSSERLPTEERC